MNDIDISNVARADDMIISAGYNISALRLKTRRLTEAVAERGDWEPDESTNIVKAFVVLRDGYVAEEQTVKTLQDYVKKKSHWYPREIDFVSELPKTETGKLQRFRLRDKERRTNSRQRRQETPPSFGLFSRFPVQAHDLPPRHRNSGNRRAGTAQVSAGIAASFRASTTRPPETPLTLNLGGREPCFRGGLQRLVLPARDFVTRSVACKPALQIKHALAPSINRVVLCQ